MKDFIKISSLIDNLGKIGTNTCLNEPVKITLMTRLQTTSQTSSRRSSNQENQSNEYNHERKNSLISNGHSLTTEILAFNVGRELIIYEFSEATQVCFTRRIFNSKTKRIV